MPKVFVTYSKEMTKRSKAHAFFMKMKIKRDSELDPFTIKDIIGVIGEI